MTAVWKFPVPAYGGESFVTMPAGAEMLHVAVQDGVPYLWARVRPDAPLRSRYVRTYATGEAIDGSPEYLGTFHIDWTVWHVFYTSTDLPLADER